MIVQYISLTSYVFWFFVSGFMDDWKVIICTNTEVNTQTFQPVYRRSKCVLIDKAITV